MAFKQIQKNAMLEALEISKAKTVTGYLTGVKIRTKGSGKKARESIIYQMQKKDGEIFELWGCTAINQEVLQGKQIDPGFQNLMVRFTFLGKKKVPGRTQAMKLVKVEVDIDDRLANGKAYALKPAKKFKK